MLPALQVLLLRHAGPLDTLGESYRKLFGGPYQIAFSPDGGLLASVSDDGTLRLWDVKTGASVKTIRAYGEAGAVAFSPDGALIAVSVWGEGVQVWGVAP